MHCNTFQLPVVLLLSILLMLFVVCLILNKFRIKLVTIVETKMILPFMLTRTSYEFNNFVTSITEGSL